MSRLLLINMLDMAVISIVIESWSLIFFVHEKVTHAVELDFMSKWRHQRAVSDRFGYS